MKNWLYWSCQILGWCAYSAIALAVTTVFTAWRTDIALGFVLFFLYSIVLTHILRSQIRRRQWLTLPAMQSLPRIFSAAMATALIQTFLVIVIAWALQGSNAFDATATVSTAAGIVFITCAWAAIYVGFHWYRGYRDAQFREVQTQLFLRQAELRALQAQVNPHFLFNSLNAIRGMVSEDTERAQHMITSLANLFRRSLQFSSSQMVTLEEEMAAVSDYLALESTRFEERLQVRVNIGEDAVKCALPAMLLQTLVENAVKHGISRLPAGGSIEIDGTTVQKSLVLRIVNTGTLGNHDPNGTHTGLANTRERLHLLCGDKATLDLSDDEGTVTATVVIPQTA